MHKLELAGSQIGSAFDAAMQVDPEFDVGSTFAAILRNKFLETVA